MAHRDVGCRGGGGLPRLVQPFESGLRVGTLGVVGRELCARDLDRFLKEGQGFRFQISSGEQFAQGGQRGYQRAAARNQCVALQGERAPQKGFSFCGLSEEHSHTCDAVGVPDGC